MKVALTQHDAGFFWYSGLLEDQLERNPRIASALSTRTLGLLGLPFSFEKGKGRKANRAKEELTELWPHIAPADALAEILRNLVMLGFAIAEVVWTTTDGRWVPTLYPVHPVFTRWDRSIDRFTVQSWGDQVPIEPGNGRWVVLTRGRRWGWLRGTLRCLGLQDAIRSYAVRDWARYSEKHGMPILKITVPMTENVEADDIVSNALSQLGNESTLTLPQNDEGHGFDADMIEATANTWQAFDGLIKQCDSDVSIAILGQNLTTQVSGGSLAAAKVHQQVRQDYLESDVMVLSEAIRMQLLGPWAVWNYGDRDCAPKPLWNCAPPEDLSVTTTTQAAALKNLRELRNLGVEIDEKAYLERVGITAKTIVVPEAQPLPDTTNTDPDKSKEGEEDPGKSQDEEQDTHDSQS